MKINKSNLQKYLKCYNKKNFISKITVRQFNKSLCKKYPFLIPRNRWSGEIVEDYDYSWTELDALSYGWYLTFGLEIVEEIYQELKKFDFVDKYKISQIKEKYGTLRWYDFGTPVGKKSEEYDIVKIDSDDKLEGNLHEYIYDLDHVDDPDVKYEELPWGEKGKLYPRYSDKAIKYYKRYKIIEPCRIDDIISKYEKLSEDICYECGKPSKYVTGGWITYICEDCAKKHLEKMKQSKFYNIDVNETVETYYTTKEKYNED